MIEVIIAVMSWSFKANTVANAWCKYHVTDVSITRKSIYNLFLKLVSYHNRPHKGLQFLTTQSHWHDVRNCLNPAPINMNAMRIKYSRYLKLFTFFTSVIWWNETPEILTYLAKLSNLPSKRNQREWRIITNGEKWRNKLYIKENLQISKWINLFLD